MEINNENDLIHEEKITLLLVKYKYELSKWQFSGITSSKTTAFSWRAETHFKSFIFPVIIITR